MLMNTYKITFLLIFLLLFSCASDEEKERNNDYRVQSNKDDYQRELNQLNQRIKKSPNDIESVIKRGNLELNHYEFANAFADAALAYRLDSNNFEARLLYGIAILNRPDRAENDKRIAQRHFAQLLIQRPEDLKAIVGYANTYALLQDFDNARVWINKALSIDPNHIDAFILKGSIYKVLYNALKEDPESQDLSKAYLDTAVSTYSYITQIDPEFHAAYMHLGLLFEQRRDSICLDHYLSAVQLQPENLQYKYALAYAHGEFGHEREAIRIYEEMIEQDENFYEAYCQTAQILQFKYQQLDSALYYYSKVVKKDPSHLDAFVNMGIAYQDMGDVTNALKNYARALAIKPEERNPMTSLMQFEEHQKMARDRAEQLKKNL